MEMEYRGRKSFWYKEVWGSKKVIIQVNNCILCGPCFALTSPAFASGFPQPFSTCSNANIQFKYQHLHVILLFTQTKNESVFSLKSHSMLSTCFSGHFLLFSIVCEFVHFIFATTTNKNHFNVYCNSCLKSNFTQIFILFSWLQMEKMKVRKPQVLLLEPGYEFRFSEFTARVLLFHQITLCVHIYMKIAMKVTKDFLIFKMLLFLTTLLKMSSEDVI